MTKRWQYYAFLLRLWQEEGAPDKPPRWRASLQSPTNSEVLGFASLQEMYSFLEKKLTLPAPPPDLAKDDQGSQQPT